MLNTIKLTLTRTLLYTLLAAISVACTAAPAEPAIPTATDVPPTEVATQAPTEVPTEMPTVEPTQSAAEIYQDPTQPIAARVDAVLAEMTLAEKIGQMTLIEKGSIDPTAVTDYAIGGILSGGGGYPKGNNTPEGWAEMVDGYQQAALDTRLGIPMIYGVDAVHGHSNVVGTVVFPHNIGLGAANNPELMTRIGEITAAEMVATGIYWNYGPAVSVPQDIRWGRTYEGYSEDTAIVSSLSSAYLRGLQQDDLSAPDTVLATVKHFVADGGTRWGSSTTGNYQMDQGVARGDMELLRRVHLPPYEVAIENGAQSVMISFSSWNYVKMHGNRELITGVLIDELGFDGFIVADWGGVDQISLSYYESVVRAINAGIDMNMVPYDYETFINTLTIAVDAGDVSEDRIDEAVRNILKVKFALGLFEAPFSNPDYLERVGSDAHREVARQAVRESAVLLKNEGDLLPLDPAQTEIFVAGKAADDIGIQSGGWTIEWQGKAGDITVGTTILEGIQATVSTDTTVHYDKFGHFDEITDTPSTCIAVVGEQPYAEGFGDDPDLELEARDKRMLRRMAETCETLTVLLVSGRPLVLNDLYDQWDAFVAVWLPGTEGQGVADVLFGDYPFTGTLPYTWPRSVDQLPFDFATLQAEDVLFSRGFGLIE